MLFRLRKSLHILNFGTRCRWMVSFTRWPLYDRRMSSRYRLDGCLDLVAKRKSYPCRESNRRRSACSQGLCRIFLFLLIHLFFLSLSPFFCLYLCFSNRIGQHNIEGRGQTSMSQARFEPTIPATNRPRPTPQTARPMWPAKTHASGRTANVTGQDPRLRPHGQCDQPRPTPQTARPMWPAKTHASGRTATVTGQDPRLRPHGHCDRLWATLLSLKKKLY
jgi:hypothetical protein